MVAQASTRGGNVVTSFSMDPNIWSNLETDLWRTIFGKLPFREFFQLRVVCKERHQLASDRNFLEFERSFTAVTPKPFFVLVTEYVRKRATKKNLPLEKFQRHGLLRYDASCHRWSWTWLPLLTTTRGSLAMEGLIYSGADQVINLHTRVFHTLARPPDHPSPFLGLAILKYNIGMTSLDRSKIPYTFQIVVGHKHHTVIYNSRTNSWTHKGTPEQSSDQRSWHYTNSSKVVCTLQWVLVHQCTERVRTSTRSRDEVSSRARHVGKLYTSRWPQYS